MKKPPAQKAHAFGSKGGEKRPKVGGGVSRTAEVEGAVLHVAERRKIGRGRFGSTARFLTRGRWASPIRKVSAHRRCPLRDARVTPRKWARRERSSSVALKRPQRMRSL